MGLNFIDSSFSIFFPIILIRNRVKSLIRQRDRQEEASIAKQVKINPKKILKYVNSKAKSRKGIPSIRYQFNGVDVLAETDQEKASVLNNYFKTVEEGGQASG